MRQNTMFPNLIQKLNTAEDVDLLTELVGYEEHCPQADRIHSSVRMEGVSP
ncbi:hypothetical protein ACQKDD_17635 [Planococcus kocurii]|uniref:hypothetical protein n=1 Tax=Planococcus kocurii TaxID=1374 RepID=UPI003D08CA5D